LYHKETLLILFFLSYNEKKNLTMVEVGWYINRASARNGDWVGEEKS